MSINPFVGRIEIPVSALPAGAQQITMKHELMAKLQQPTTVILMVQEKLAAVLSGTPDDVLRSEHPILFGTGIITPSPQTNIPGEYNLVSLSPGELMQHLISHLSGNLLAHPDVELDNVQIFTLVQINKNFRNGPNDVELLRSLFQTQGVRNGGIILLKKSKANPTELFVVQNVDEIDTVSFAGDSSWEFVGGDQKQIFGLLPQ